MTGEADLLSSKFFWKNIYFSGLFREKHILFIPTIQGKTVLFLKNSGKNIPENVYEPCNGKIGQRIYSIFFRAFSKTYLLVKRKIKKLID